MRISAVVLLLAVVAGGCTHDADTPDGPDGGSTQDPYVSLIEPCLSEEPGSSGQSLTGPDPAETTVDPEAGVSYRAYGEPWTDFDLGWTTPELELTFGVGQKLVAETGSDETPNWAVIGSARMPNVVGDAIVTDLECLGALVVADLIDMTGYENGAGHTEVIEQGTRSVDGRHAWLNVSRYEVIDDRFASTHEQQGTLLVDSDQGVAIVFVTVPGARSDLNAVIDEVFASVRIL